MVEQFGKQCRVTAYGCVTEQYQDIGESRDLPVCGDSSCFISREAEKSLGKIVSQGSSQSLYMEDLIAIPVRIPPIYSIPDTSSCLWPWTLHAYIWIGIESLLDLTLFLLLSSYASLDLLDVQRLQPMPLDYNRWISLVIDIHGFL